MTAAELEARWVALNPRTYWGPEFWASCRPSFDEAEEEEEA
jgi:hypothetical protein